MAWKVLLIDDDPGILRVTSIALEDAGYNVITAPDGETGLRLFKEMSPHIIITDIGLPDINGLEILRRIKEMDPDKEVIVTTAFSEIAIAIKAMQLDATGFVSKPVSTDAVLAALKRARDRYARRKVIQDYTALMEQRWMDTAEELAKSFHFQRMLIESSIDGIAACNSEGMLIVFNRSMEKMLGYTRGKVVGKKSLADLFEPGEAEKFLARLHSEDGGGLNRLFPYRSVLVDSNGDRISVLLSATVLYMGEEKLGTVVFFRDLGKPVVGE